MKEDNTKQEQGKRKEDCVIWENWVGREDQLKRILEWMPERVNKSGEFILSGKMPFFTVTDMRAVLK